MNTTLTAILKKDGPWWIGWIKEVSGVYAQEETKGFFLHRATFGRQI